MSPIPLQIPGGLELLIVFLLLLVVPGLAVLYLVGKRALGSDESDEVERLRDRVDDLERELERERGDDN